VEEGLPSIDFATFVLSLNHSALLNLGELPDLESGKREKDLPLARQTIDLIAMLEDKTKGNLSPVEQNFLQSSLYEARMAYVEVTNALSRPPDPASVAGIPKR